MKTLRVAAQRFTGILLLALFAASLLAVSRQASAQPPDADGQASTLGWDADAKGRFVMALVLDRQSNIWVGTEDNGVWRYAPRTQKWTQFTTADGLGDDNGYALACDGQGRIWVGHLNHGVSVFNGRQWKNYGLWDGPLGERVFDIATCPTDGDVWIAANGGLTRYSLQKDEWTYFPKTGAAALDQVSTLAFDADGNLYAGTQCDGLALASPKDDYATWREVHAPRQMPAAPTGTGLPSDMINDVLAARDGTVYAATTGGLAWSADRGQNWSFVRGEDWEQNLQGLYQNPYLVLPTPPADLKMQGDLLLEDWVTCLSEDSAGALWIGHRQHGFEARDPKSHQRVFRSDDDPQNAGDNDFVRALLLLPGPRVLAARYGGDLGGLGQAGNFGRAAPAPAPPQDTEKLPPLPAVAAPPSTLLLQAWQKAITGLPAAPAPGGGEYLGDDWRTQGDWVGRYGREHAVLYAMANPFDHELGWDPSYETRKMTGPHHVGEGGVYGWIHWLKSDNPRVLYDPSLGVRRQAEANDGSFDARTYPFSWEGPDLWIALKIPDGAHRVSLYFFNKDGHDGPNRYRDYSVELKTFANDVSAADAAPPLARTRVRDFWGGVYKQFLLQGPGRYYLKIGRNHSHVTILQALLIDKLPLQRDPRYDALPDMDDVSYDPPEAGAPDKNESEVLSAARSLWLSLDEACAQGKPAGLQWPYRVMAYRAAQAAGAPASLLDNWRWKLPAWTPDDRVQFQQVMAQAWQAKVKQQARQNTEPKEK